jgi:hypothetical protein
LCKRQVSEAPPPLASSDSRYLGASWGNQLIIWEIFSSVGTRQRPQRGQGEKIDFCDNVVFNKSQQTERKHGQAGVERKMWPPKNATSW